MNAQKATKKSISFFPKVLATAEQKAGKETNGNLSRYVQTLILRDAANSPPPPTGRARIIEELAEQWVPTIAADLKQLLQAKGVNQAELFGRCLTKLRDYLAMCDQTGPADFLFIPENKCPAFAEKQRRLGLMVSQPARAEVVEHIRALVSELQGETGEV